MRQLVVARGDAPPILEAAEAALDDIAALIGLLVMANAFEAVGFGRNDRLYSAPLEERPKGVGVVALVGHQLSDAGDQTDAGLGDRAIGRVAGCQHERPGTAEFVDKRMNLAVMPTFGDPNGLRLGPPFPPPAQRWVLT